MTTFASNGQFEAAKRIAGKRLKATDEPYIDFEDSLDDIYIEVYNSERAPLSVYQLSQEAMVQELHSRIEELEEWQDHWVAITMDSIKHGISTSPDPGKAEDELLEAFKEAEALKGKPISEIANLTPEQRKYYEASKLFRKIWKSVKVS